VFFFFFNENLALFYCSQRFIPEHCAHFDPRKFATITQKKTNINEKEN